MMLMNREQRRAWARDMERHHRECDCKARRLVAVEDFPTCPNGHVNDLLETPFFGQLDGRPTTWMLTGSPLGSETETYLGCSQCDEEVSVVVRVGVV
jgi:hypothetical protein